MEEAVPPKKKSTFKLILLLVLGFILLSFILQGAGMKVMKTTEDAEIVNRPHAN